ncbi:hypothetical protein ACOSP7_019925 [Xanthoceras sorbifolium]
MGSEDHFEGPWGGNGGRKWEYKPEGGITEITIRYGDVIDSISFKNDGDNSSPKFGGECGDSTKVFKINSPSEYLTSLSGTHMMYYGHRVVGTLYFTTNYGTTHKVYGSKKDHGSSEAFEFSLKDRFIVGFFGRRGNFVDAIGVYYKDPPRSIGSEDRSEGPWGGTYGYEWEYKPNSGITEITIHYGDVIDSLSFKNVGENCSSPKYGGECGDNTNKFTIDSPSEYLISVSGTYIIYCHHPTVASLCFTTNHGIKHQVFGSEKNHQTSKSFEFSLKNKVITGFFWKSSQFH